VINSDSKESTTMSRHLSECVEVPLKKQVVTTTTSTCTNNASNPKTVVSTEQNKISTKVVPAVSNILSINKVHSSKVTQSQDSTSMPAVSSVLSINKVHSSKVTQPQDSTSMHYIKFRLSLILQHRFNNCLILITKVSFIVADNTQKTQMSNNISSNSPVKSSMTPIMTQSTKVSSKIISCGYLFIINKNAYKSYA